MTTAGAWPSGLLLLCPGQGGQHAAMFDLARTSAGASALLDRLAPDLPGPGADLYANRHAQPLIVAATLAMWEAIRDVAPPPALVAGYSIGELAAYGVAGAFDAQQAVTLAVRRAQLMDACLAQHPGQALVAISGLMLARAGTLAATSGFTVGIENGDDSCIAGGPAAQADALLAAVAAAGGRATRLPVEVASHTPYMAGAVPLFAQALEQTGFGPMAAPVLAGISAVAIDGPPPAVAALSRQLAEPVRWAACMDACAEAGIAYALELGPGNALARMLQARHPRINTRSVADFRSLDGIRRWLARAADDGRAPY
ncbi:MAG: acyltransferase domain-containing protein [Duganella sp.]